MFKDTRVVLLALLCLILANGGCNSLTPTDLSVQPTHTPTVRPTAVDRGLLYGEPCDPPCWEGITPGSSSEDDVVRVLERLKAEGRIASYTKLTELYYLAQFPSGGTVDILFADKYVSRLIVGYMGSFDYRVRQVVERFGEPEAYAVYSRGSEGSCSCEDWDRFGAYANHSAPAYLLYPSRGMTVVVQVPAGYQGHVCPEMKTSVFHYYPARSLADALRESNSPAFTAADWSSEHLVQWHGYGPGY